MVLGTVVSILAQAGEEVGWRGYALPRLAAYVGLGGASLLIGLIWALWHLPLFVLPDSGSTGQSFLAYLLQVTAMSVVFAFLYWKTDGSLLLVMLLHAAVNNTTGIVPAAVGEGITAIAFGASLVAWATVALSWAVAVPLLLLMRGADIQGMFVTRTQESG
jgi:membrane protease YdiL (CAAX protease family)